MTERIRVSEAEIRVAKEIFKETKSFTEISKKLGRPETVWRYHLIGTYKQYIKDYCKNRYKTDKKYREKIKNTTREYYLNNKDKVLASKKQYCRDYYDKHKEKYREYARNYFQKNKKTLMEKTKIWRKNNPEKARETRANYYQKNKKKLLAYMKQYREKHPEIIKKYANKNKEKLKAWRDARRDKKSEYDKERYYADLDKSRRLSREKYWKSKLKKM